MKQLSAIAKKVYDVQIEMKSGLQFPDEQVFRMQEIIMLFPDKYGAEDTY